MFLLLISTVLQPAPYEKNDKPVFNLTETTAQAENSQKPKESDSKMKSEKTQDKSKKDSTSKKKNSATTVYSTPAQEKKEATPVSKTPATTKTEQPVKQEASAKSEQQKQPEKNTTVQPSPVARQKYNFAAAKNGAQLVFVFDDGGQNLAHLKSFLQLPFPITVAVLPRIAHSKESASQIRASGNEVILHQPMQSINPSVNPGPGAIKPGMTEDEITSTLFQNITEIAPIAGMNNHEGSAITADAEKMAVIMRTASQEGIYFLDSRTNVETKVPYVGRELGYSWYERNIFLDNEKTKENALKELKKGLDLANKNGSVIMIGHIWSADFLPAFLQEVYPELKEAGYTFSTVSKSRAKRN